MQGPPAQWYIQFVLPPLCELTQTAAARTASAAAAHLQQLPLLETTGVSTLWCNSHLVTVVPCWSIVWLAQNINKIRYHNTMTNRSLMEEEANKVKRMVQVLQSLQQENKGDMIIKYLLLILAYKRAVVCEHPYQTAGTI